MYIAKYIRYPLMLVAAILFMSSVTARAADIASVSNAWVRATVPGQNVAAAYMDITAHTPATLVGAETSVAGKVALHQMSMEAGVMKMRQVVRIALPANQKVSLGAAGYHLMLVDTRRELKAGDRVPLALILRNGQGVKSTVQVDAEVRAVNEGAAHHH